MDLVISSRSSPKFASGVNDRRKAPYTDNIHLAYTRGKNMWISCIVVVGFGEDFIGACEEHCSLLIAIFKQKGQPTWTHFLASLNVNLWDSNLWIPHMTMKEWWYDEDSMTMIQCQTQHEDWLTIAWWQRNDCMTMKEWRLEWKQRNVDEGVYACWSSHLILNHARPQNIGGRGKENFT